MCMICVVQSILSNLIHCHALLGFVMRLPSQSVTARFLSVAGRPRVLHRMWACVHAYAFLIVATRGRGCSAVLGHAITVLGLRRRPARTLIGLRGSPARTLNKSYERLRESQFAHGPFIYTMMVAHMLVTATNISGNQCCNSSNTS